MGANLFPSDRWALTHVELHFNMLYYSFIFIRLYVRNAQIYIIIIIECLWYILTSDGVFEAISFIF